MKKKHWVLCEEDTPLIAGGYQYCSVNVIGATETGKELEVFFNYRNCLWYDWNTGRKCKDKIVKWRSK